jgi:circadian clock protein KaiC
MRGSTHHKDIREIEISDKGLKIKEPFRQIIGVLSGNPQIVTYQAVDSSS